jgi:hypothetical protein
VQRKLENAKGICCQHNASVMREASTVGITLVALVVTIVILLILAGITIMYTVGDNGILRAAQEAKNKTEDAIRNEQQSLGELANMLKNEYGGGSGNNEGDGSGGGNEDIVKPPEPPKEEIEETTAFLRANGVIDIVWLDTENKVIKEPISPANYLGGLTAIKYNEQTKEEETVTNPATDTSWYKYVEQTGNADGKTSNWANARSSDKNAYFVWIPRYAYKITYFNSPENAEAYRANNKSTEGIIGYSNINGIIDVSSETEKLVKGSEPINVAGTVKTVGYADYIPHPAFEFDGAKAGIWVGKFESSGSISKVTIIPNKSSYKGTGVSGIFTACQGVKTTYSLTGDSHMMKNIEWGAVVYLAESKYGRNGTEITTNSSSSYLTGGGSYISNVLQSTTGNIYGIYDMNGGSWEYVAGYINNSYVSSSGYNTSLIEAVKTNPKYADVYPITADNQDTNYSNSKRIKGDAVFETSTGGRDSTSWHSDFSRFPYGSAPVFMRSR